MFSFFYGEWLRILEDDGENTCFFLVENTLMFDKNAYVFHVKKVVKLNKNGAFFTVLRHEEPMGAPKSKKKNCNPFHYF